MNHAASDDNVTLLFRDSLPVVKADASGVMMYHGYARLVLNLPALGRVAVVMTHLHPRSSVLRLAEAQNVLAKAMFEPHALVMGDFNSFAESDKLPSTTELPSNTRARLQEPFGTLDCGPVGLFLRHGFNDVGASAAHPTYPTDLLGKAERSGVRLRLDYMLATLSVAQRAEATTISTLEAHSASDHLPLLCDLQIGL